MTTLENALAALEITNKRIDELEKYNLDLASESFNKSNMIDYERGKNSEIAAQVDALRQQLKIAYDCITCADETGYVQDVGFVDLEQVALDINATLKATPAQCLLEVKAEAGRAAYVHCLNNWSTEVKPSAFAGLADEYANKIRGGE